MYQVIVAGCRLENADNLLGIGFKNTDGKSTMSWGLKADMDHFRGVTTGHFVMTGRVTWDTFNEKYKPLSNRINIVVSTDFKKLNETKEKMYDKPMINVNCNGLNGENIGHNYVIFVKDVKSGFDFYKSMIETRTDYKDKKLFVIGGETIYQQMIEQFPNELDKLFLTEIYTPYKCNIFFPVGLYMKRSLKTIFTTPKIVGDDTMLKDKKIEYDIKIYQFEKINSKDEK